MLKVSDLKSLNPDKIYAHKRMKITNFWGEEQRLRKAEWFFFYTCGSKGNKWRQYHKGNFREDNIILQESFILDVLNGKKQLYETILSRLDKYLIEIYELDSLDEILSIKMMEELI